MQAVSAISAVTVSQNNAQVRNDGDHSGEKSFEAVLREAEGAESAEPLESNSENVTEERAAEGVLHGREALRQRVRRTDTDQEAPASHMTATQSVQALLGGLLGDLAPVIAASPADAASEAAVGSVGTGALETAVGLVGEITKPAAQPTLLATQLAGANNTPGASGEELAESAELLTGSSLMGSSSMGSTPSGFDRTSQAVTELVETAALAPNTPAVEETLANNDADSGAAIAEVPVEHSTTTPSVVKAPDGASARVEVSVVSTGSAVQRGAVDSSMVDAAKAAWQGLELQRVGRNVAASVQTAHGEISVVAQIANGETHMLAELPSTLARAMSAQVQSELRRELHDNGVRTGEMEFRQSDPEPQQNRPRGDQGEEAEHDWS
jgi:hypothetical protein